jgi:hypothetical protein
MADILPEPRLGDQDVLSVSDTEAEKARVYFFPDGPGGTAQQACGLLDGQEIKVAGLIHLPFLDTKD